LTVTGPGVRIPLSPPLFKVKPCKLNTYRVFYFMVVGSVVVLVRFEAKKGINSKLLFFVYLINTLQVKENVNY
jgi:hypothetical protein